VGGGEACEARHRLGLATRRGLVFPRRQLVAMAFGLQPYGVDDVLAVLGVPHLSGDYTAEREEWLGDDDVKELAAKIVEARGRSNDS
jgi:hypothetical protein